MGKERPILFSAPMVRAILDGRKTQTRRVVKLPGYTIDERDDGAPWPHCSTWSHGDNGSPWAACPYGAPAGPWRMLRDVQPPADGRYEVAWEEGDAPQLVYLRRCDEDDDDAPPWVWGRTEIDDPEAVGLDVRDPWAIRWRAPGDRLWVRETWEDPADHCPRCQLSVPGAPCWCCNWEQVSYRATPEGGNDDRRWRPSIHMPRWASRITLAVESVRVERLQDIGERDARAEGAEPLQYDFGGGPLGDGKQWKSHRDAFEVLWREINGAESWSANPWVWVINFSRVTP